MARKYRQNTFFFVGFVNQARYGFGVSLELEIQEHSTQRTFQCVNKLVSQICSSNLYEQGYCTSHVFFQKLCFRPNLLLCCTQKFYALFENILPKNGLSFIFQTCYLALWLRWGQGEWEKTQEDDGKQKFHIESDFTCLDWFNSNNWSLW